MKIAETGQLQHAANMTAMSQPAASRMLSEIETLVGGPVFTRHAKGMEATQLGALCLRHAKIILEQMDELEAEATRFSEGSIGSVKVGAVTGPAVGILMPAIKRMKQKIPDLDMTIEVAPSIELVRGLVEGRFDFVISRLPPTYDSRDFLLQPVGSEMVSLLVGPDHPLANQKKCVS